MKTRTTSEKNPQRPGYGKEGKEVILWTNYFNLDYPDNLELYRYEVSIAGGGREPPVGKKAKRIIQLLLEEHFLPHIHNIAADFKLNLISRDKLDIKEDPYHVTYRAEEEDSSAPNATQYDIHIEFKGSLTLSSLINHLTSTQAGLMSGSKDEIIQALNIVLGHHSKTDPSVATVAANRHFSMNTTAQNTTAQNTMAQNGTSPDLGAGLQVIQGFFLSVRAATARILVNVQVKNMAFHDKGRLDNIMKVYMRDTSSNKIELLKFVKGLSVDVTHIKRTNSRGQRIPRIKTVQGFATQDDGPRNAAGVRLPHHPIVSQFGAGAKEVQFFLDTSAGASSSQPAPAALSGKKRPSTGSYISVFDFFKESKSPMLQR